SGWVDEDTVFESDQRLKKKKRDTLSGPMKEYLENRDQFLAITMILKGQGDYVSESYVSIALLWLLCVKIAAFSVTVEIHYIGSIIGTDITLNVFPYAAWGAEDFTVLHTNGIHHITLLYCGCTASVWEDSKLQRRKWEQLMLHEWFPSTTVRPKTACTFRCLEQFQLMTLTGKITAYDYVTSMPYLGLTSDLGRPSDQS
ncbi:hypothetical protein MPER_13258, partial [Moniliophthora perniciosa FA553]